MKLNERSMKALVGVHPDLVRVVELAAERCEVPIVVTEGLRNLDRQKELKAAGKSWTLDSRHLTGHAVDLVDADNYAYDIPDLDKIAAAMRTASDDLKVPIVWGGDWKSRDTPHFELCRKAYPASGVAATTRVAEAASIIARGRIMIAGAAATTAAVAKDAADTVSAVKTPIIPPVSDGIAQTIHNVAGWSKILGNHDSMVFVYGALAFGLTAGVLFVAGKLRT